MKKRYFGSDGVEVCAWSFLYDEGVKERERGRAKLEAVSLTVWEGPIPKPSIRWLNCCAFEPDHRERVASSQATIRQAGSRRQEVKY